MLNTPIFLIAAIAACWRITWDLTRKDDEGGQFSGPFRLYDAIRFVFRHPIMPVWVQHAVDCVFCVSMWAAGFFCLLIPVYGGYTWIETLRAWLVYTVGVSGVVAWYYRYIRMMYATGAGDF
jgi:hypothetical protein